MDELQKLRDFVETLISYSELVNGTDPLIIRRTNSFNGLATVFVCAPTRPDSTLLPINSYWVNTDETSPDYKKAYYRAFTNTWVELTDTPVDNWHKVTYADADSLSTNLEVADEDTLGTVTLSADALVATDPVVITEGDVSLSNARAPLEHDELHPEVPARQILTPDGSLHIDRSLFGQYKYMTVVSNTDAYWSFAQLPVPGVSVLPTPVNYDRDSVSDSAVYDETNVTNVEVYLV